MLSLVLVTGLVDSFNPCAIGVLLLYVTILLGMKTSRKFILLFGAFYIVATFVTYFLIGLSLLHVVHYFGISHFFGWAAAALALFIGLYTLKDYFWPAWQIPVVSAVLSRCRIVTVNRNLTITSAVILGVLIGLCEFPCSGGVYLSTVALLSLKETFWQGVFYLLVYNVMFILPLVLIFLFAMNKRVLAKLQKWQGSQAGRIKLISGSLMTLLGIFLLVWLIIVST